MTNYLAGIAISLAAVSSASAQEVRASRPGDIAVVLEQAPGVGGICGTGADGRTMCVSPSHGYAPSSIAENTRTRFDEEALESAIIAAAMGDAIPNPGDQFAVRFNFAGDGDTFAGAFSFGLNATDNLRLNLNVGQGASKTIAGGGFNLSF
ncbi:hypothetical protein [Roseibium sp. Sym1]|uniref:hypothetical protein n=1 Tax=Roseibium sp. Sym1 TaxID=3016006 RepID=UPI0022B4F57B|nr:hypothetical protein [Roseibium sp. Sym1]